MLRFLIFIMFLAAIFPIVALAQGTPTDPQFDISLFILGLLAQSAPAMIVSGWIATHVTGATGWTMKVQSFLIAVIMTMLYALVGVLPVPFSEVWKWIALGATNGVLANLLYKIDLFNELLTLLKARTVHQLTPTD